MGIAMAYCVAAILLGVADEQSGNKRAFPAALAQLAANEKVQEAVVDKGLEVAGKLIDNQMKILEEQPEKAAEFLKKKFNFDVRAEKGWASTDMFVPPSYHIQSNVEGEEPDEEKEMDKVSPEPYNYQAGIGSVIMNGCWGTGYKDGDPCFNAMEKTTQCRNMIDGAAFIGVGFDLRGKYSPDARKMSIIQRNCGGHSMYDNFQVPDTMNVHGIYDTSATMMMFESQSQYQHYLEHEAGVSGSLFGFYGGVKEAWGSSSSFSKETYLSVFDIDVDRYEIFKDEVKPGDLSRAFLQEFMSLPPSNFDQGGFIAYQDFILRWGTHYIKSARFGGQLEFRKTIVNTGSQKKEQIAMEAEAEYRSIFWSAGATSSTESGTTQREQKKFASSSLVAQGGSQKIASVLSDMYSPTFKQEFKAWLESIDDYPKAFKFHMSPIAELLNFRGNDLFPDEKLQWGCESQSEATLQTDATTGKKYYITQVDKKDTKIYCEYTERDQITSQIKQRRESLERAIEIYLEEGPVSASDVSLEAGEPGCEAARLDLTPPSTPPTWADITGVNPKKVQIIFDMKADLISKTEGGFGINIPKDMTRLLMFSQKKWYTSEEKNHFHLYDGFDNGNTGDATTKKISIFGLVSTYDPKTGALKVDSADFAESKKFFTIPDNLKGMQLAKIQWPSEELFKRIEKNSLGYLPCNVGWSNVMQFDPRTEFGGKCLHFAAASAGPIFVVFSAIPKNKDTWYYVEISPWGVGMYKSQRLQVSTVDPNAVGLGEPKLYQSYFVCLKETGTSTVIEYGKTFGQTTQGDVYLTMIDTLNKPEGNRPLQVRFYAYGNGPYDMQVMGSHVLDRGLTQTTCMGATKKDPKRPYCVQNCHPACEPLAGCKQKQVGTLLPTECNQCRVAKDQDNPQECVEECPVTQQPDKNRVCRDEYELSFKTGTSRDKVKLEGLNFLKDFTVCVWIKLDKQLPLENNYYDVWTYNTKQNDMFGLKLLRHSSQSSEVRYYFYVRSDGQTTSQIGKSTFVADKWHMVCVGFESNTGKRSVVIDQDYKQEPGSPLQEWAVLGGVGEFYIDATIELGAISDLNIWDRVLTREEFQPMWESCGAVPGHAKDWFEIHAVIPTVVGSKYSIDKPSSCRPSLSTAPETRRSKKSRVRKSRKPSAVSKTP